MLNLFEVTAEKRTLGILMLDCCHVRGQKTLRTFIHGTLPAQRPDAYAGRYQRPKNLWDPRAGPIIKSEASRNLRTLRLDAIRGQGILGISVLDLYQIRGHRTLVNVILDHSQEKPWTTHVGGLCG
jgi:hypothetical protein